MAFGHFLLGSHNFMVTALGLCVTCPKYCCASLASKVTIVWTISNTNSRDSLMDTESCACNSKRLKSSPYTPCFFCPDRAGPSAQTQYKDIMRSIWLALDFGFYMSTKCVVHEKPIDWYFKITCKWFGNKISHERLMPPEKTLLIRALVLWEFEWANAPLELFGDSLVNMPKM